MLSRPVVLVSIFLMSGAAIFAACGGSATTIPGGTSDAGSVTDGSTVSDGSTVTNEGGEVTDASASDANESTDASASVDGGDSGACSSLDPGGEKNIPVDFGGETAPPPTGGTIVPGTYHLARVVVYGADVPDSGTTGALEKGLLDVTATTFATATIATAAGTTTTRRDSYGTYVIDADGGKDIDLTETCPKSDSAQIGYSVDVAGIRLRTQVVVGAKTLDAETSYTP